ncbi:MAG: long-chain acyl-CoA synthetase, partial [Francisellaceae bacterium]
ASFVPMLIFGHKNLFVPNPRDLKMFIKIAKNNKFTAITGVNTLFSALAHNQDFQSGDYSQLKVSWAGGMPVQAHVAKKWHEVTGCPLQVAYGLSETSPGVTADLYNTKDFSSSIGYPFPNTDVEIRDIKTGEIKSIGESGEICVKGPQVMRGYLNKPEETVSALQDGWFKTGDVGIMNEQGQIKLVDRTKDMVIVSGFNVYTVEVEHTIAELPEVLDVAVIGLPCEKTGEMLKAHIILKEGQKLTAQHVIDYCHENITRYKTPKMIEFNDVLPLSPVGKILKTKLRALPQNAKYFAKKLSD